MDDSAAAFQRGKVLGRYRIERLLGQGGMGQVYQAFDVVLRRYVALKIVTSRDAFADVLDVRHASALVLREARAAAALSHANAVAIFDVGEVDDTPFIAMELVEGITLRNYIGNQSVPLEHRIRWLVEVARVLDAAHAVGLVHRDIKPANVMVSREGAVKVLDFGIARRTIGDGPHSAPGSRGSREGPLSLTTLGGVGGTPRYMAPEQLDGVPADGRSDQYSWGLVAFELLVGAHPATFDRPDRPPLPAIAVAEASPGAPPAIAAVIDRALAIHPDDRHPSMAAIASSLEPFLVPLGSYSAPNLAALAALSEGANPSTGGFLSTGDILSAGAPKDTETLVDATAATKLQPGPPNVTAQRPSGRPWRAAVVLSLAASVVAGIALHSHKPRALGSLTPAPLGYPIAPSSPSALPVGRAQGMILITGFEVTVVDPLLDATAARLFENALEASSAFDPAGAHRITSLARALAGGDREALPSALLARGHSRVILVRGVAVPHETGFAFSVVAKDAGNGAVVAKADRNSHGRADAVETLNALAKDLRAALGDFEATPDGCCGTSSALEADADWLLGNDLILAEKPTDALRHLERALALDPGFALAHYSLAVVYYNLGRYADSTREDALAAARLAALPVRVRLRVDGDWKAISGRYSEAIASYEELLLRWPEDAGTANDLGEIFALARQPQRALALATDSEPGKGVRSMARNNVPKYLLLSGRLQEAIDVAAKVTAENEITQVPGEVTAPSGAALALLGRRTEASATYARLLDPARRAYALADLALFKGSIDEAVKASQAMTEGKAEPSDRAHYWAFRAEVMLARGDRARALAAASKAIASEEPWARYVGARVYAALGDARKVDALAAGTEGLGPDAAHVAKLLKGIALRAHGKARESLGALEEARTLVDSWPVHLDLALSYLELGDRDSARKELETCLARRGEGALITMVYDLPTLRYVREAEALLARISADGGR